jgi:hypothetical protein
MAESTRTSAAMLEFNKQVNAAIVDPAFIASVRKKLRLDQQQAAEIFGGGVNAFSRYENGRNPTAAGAGEAAQGARPASGPAGRGAGWLKRGTRPWPPASARPGAVLARAWAWAFLSVGLTDQAPYRRRRLFKCTRPALGAFPAFLVDEVVDPKPIGNFTRLNHSDPEVSVLQATTSM